ncbi:MAG: hypothetical protein R6V58_10860 [Planctomycetota bacterium]
MCYLTVDPRIPFALWWPLAATAAVLLVVYAVAAWNRLPRGRRSAIVALMTAAVAVPLLVLLNPTWLERVPPPEGKPLLTILVDRSGSMATADAPGDATRFDAAARVAEATAGELADRYEVRVRAFADDWSPVPVATLKERPPDGTATDLAAAVEQTLDESRVQGQAVLLLSDGIHNARGGGARLRRAAARARALAAPIYAHVLGGPAEVDDVEVTLNLPQELAFVDQSVPVAVSVRQRGRLADHATLTLSRDDELIETRRIDLAPDEAVEAVFHVAEAESGLYRYGIRAEPVPGEVTEVNNAASLLLRVVDEPVRVLLLEGKPYWDTKFFIRTLAADPSIELTSIVRMAEGRLLERVTSQGRRRDAAGEDAEGDDAGKEPVDRWSIREDPAAVLAGAGSPDDYQIVVLGRDAELFLTDEALRNLKNWLADGNGSLVCYRGAPASKIGQRLGELLPVRWSASGEARYRVQLTEAGQALRWLPQSDQRANTLATLPSLATGRRVESVQPLATVLATTDGEEPAPVLAYQPYGGGRVVVVEGAGMWRWAFLSDEAREDGEVYGTFWRSLVRWLVSNVGLLPSQTMALRTDKLTFSTDESVTATLLIHQDHLGSELPRVELVPEDADSEGSGAEMFTPVPMGDLMGQFQVRFGVLPEGRYKARVVGAAEDDLSTVAMFDVRGSLAERLDVRARTGVMNLLAEESGGAMLDPAGPDLLAERFDAHRRRSQPDRIARTTAWDRWWVLSGSLLLWTIAWGLRRRSGLV